MEVSYIYIHSVYIQRNCLCIIRGSPWLVKLRLRQIKNRNDSKNPFVTKLVTLLVKTRAVSHAEIKLKTACSEKQVGTFLDSGGESHE